MNIIYFLIPITIGLLLLAIFFFFWAVNNNQFEDTSCPSKHIILDDETRL